MEKFLMVFIVAVSVLFSGSVPTAIAKDPVAPTLTLVPMSGLPLSKLTFYGAGFVPGEKVKVLLSIDGVEFVWGGKGTKAGTGPMVSGEAGINVVNEYGAFKLTPTGGIPPGQVVKPGVYTVKAIGDKGSLATYPLEVLPPPPKK
jgi:hypothetical protein